MKSLIGFVDGQTTNPSLIAKNPEIQRLIASGHRLSSQEEKDEYKKIVQSISPLVGDAGVSIEVFADLGTRAEERIHLRHTLALDRHQEAVAEMVVRQNLRF
ncbi:MAG TPA: hypothetical protein VF311_15655 [Terriglobales bacterium]